MADWTDNHKMTTDRKDDQSENYGFTLVINTPLPVYDSGLETVGGCGGANIKYKRHGNKRRENKKRHCRNYRAILYDRYGKIF